jgi:hypothetical protein
MLVPANTGNITEFFRQKKQTPLGEHAKLRNREVPMRNSAHVAVTFAHDWDFSRPPSGMAVA